MTDIPNDNPLAMEQTKENDEVPQAHCLDYRVSIERFEGPLDLLLHLIKSNDLDIYDIPIALILEQYLAYVEEAQELNIDLAGDFLLTAAELILIKSRMLMPTEEEAGEEGPDPRDELVRRLLEYQRYKEAGEQLADRPLLGKDVFKRGATVELPEEEGTLEADLTMLLLAFQSVLQRMPQDTIYEIETERFTVQEKILALTEQLKKEREAKFQELFNLSLGRSDVVVTFLALLEMVKMKLITIRQGDHFDEIYVASQVGLA